MTAPTARRGMPPFLSAPETYRAASVEKVSIVPTYVRISLCTKPVRISRYKKQKHCRYIRMQDPEGDEPRFIIPL